MSFFPSKNAIALALGLLVSATLVARADEPSPQALALATKLIGDIGLQASIDSFVPSMFGGVERSVTGMHPEMQSAVHETLVSLQPEFLKTDQSMVDDVAHVLAARMTEQEMRDTSAFFESPLGKKYLSVQPVLLQELSISAQVWQPRESAELIARLREEMKKKGYNF